MALDTAPSNAQDGRETASGSSHTFRPDPLYVTLPLAWLVLVALWTALASFLVPVQVQRLTGSTDVAALGLATTIGTLAAAIGNPVFGQLSDRTRRRLGRRTPWMVACALGGAVTLLLQSAASSILMLGIAYAGTQLILNGFQAALAAVVPDRVPSAKIGRASSLVAVGVNAGVVAGSLIFSLYPELAGPGGYYLMAGLIVGTAILFAMASPDADSRDLPRQPLHLGQFLRNLWVSPRKYPDFSWVFLSRLLLMLGFFLFFAFFYFALQDYVGLSAEDALSAAGTMYAANGIAAILGSLATTPLADRFGRLKIFVVISGLMLAGSMLIPLVMPDYAGMMTFSIVNGFAFGVYWAVDTALVNKVLPQAVAAAKDLGIMNLTQTIPQVASGTIGAVVVSLWDYSGLFAFCGLVSMSGAFFVLRVRNVR